MLAAMAPCARLYAYLGCQLAAAQPAASHRYARWAATYSGAQYRSWVARKERLLDRCGGAVPYGEYQGVKARQQQMRQGWGMSGRNAPMICRAHRRVKRHGQNNAMGTGSVGSRQRFAWVDLCLMR